jgi:hypothetical protein
MGMAGNFIGATGKNKRDKAKNANGKSLQAESLLFPNFHTTHSLKIISY